MDRRRRERHARHVRIQQLTEEFENPRIVPAVRHIDAEGIGFVAGERGADRLRQLLTGIKRVGPLHREIMRCLRPEHSRQEIRRGPDHRTVDEREIELVHHQRFRRQPLAIAQRQPPGEIVVRIRRRRFHAFSSTDDVRP